MNTSQARVIDPILTSHARGFLKNTNVGHLLFPKVPVSQRGGNVIEFGKEAFKKYNAKRTPGSNTKRISFGYVGKPFALVQESLEGTVPFENLEDANRVPGIDLGKRSINLTMDVLENQLEIEQAELATSAANYDTGSKKVLSGTSLWTDTDNSKPITDIENAKEAVRGKVGVRPNTIIFSAKKWREFRNHPSVIARFSNKSNAQVTVSKEMAADLLEVKTVAVGDAVYADTNGDFVDVWGDGVVVAYVAESSIGAEQPSYGYTYVLDGNPAAESPYSDRNMKSWIYPVNYERVPVQSGMAAGYLITE